MENDFDRLYTVRVVEEHTIDVFAESETDAIEKAEREAFCQVPDYVSSEVISCD